MEAIQLLGAVTGLALVSGINLYATVLTVGLGIHLGFIQLPPEQAALSVFGHPYVISAVAVAYTLEFFADKIPWVDSLWDTLHTFVRPVGAALVGINAVGTVDPAVEMAVMLLCGGVSFLSHSAKAGTRFVVNHSPEPFSNIGLSLAEDVCVIGGTWAAFEHPLAMLAFTVLFVTGVLLFAPKIFRLLRVEVLAISSLFGMLFNGTGTSDPPVLFDDVPDNLFNKILADTASEERRFCIRCVSGKGVEPGRNRVGFLYMAGGRLCFVTRKKFRTCKVGFDISEITELKFYKKRLLDRLVFRYGKKNVSLHLFKNRPDRGQKIAEILETARRVI